jgi:hypothetical protein
MKTLYTFLFVVGAIGCFGQAIKILPVDSNRVELQRRDMVTSLNTLRDSMNHTLSLFDRTMRGVSESRRKQLENSRDELTYILDKVRLDSVELATTSVNSWNEKNVSRIRSNAESYRRDLKRLTGTLSRKSF